MLVMFAQRLSACVRHGDAVARIGGDEFAIVLNGANEPTILEWVARAIVDAASKPYAIGDRLVVAGASVGTAMRCVEDEQTAGGLFAQADMALYEAKRAGKGQYTPPALGFSA